VDDQFVPGADDELLLATIFTITDISANVARIREILEEGLDEQDPEDDS
jgi:hypothetical protein